MRWLNALAQLGACLPSRYEIYNQLVCRTIASQEATEISFFRLNLAPELSSTEFQDAMALRSSSLVERWVGFSTSDAVDPKEFRHPTAMMLTKDAPVDPEACRRDPT
jgi:hypothetical protein